MSQLIGQLRRLTPQRKRMIDRPAVAERFDIGPADVQTQWKFFHIAWYYTHRIYDVRVEIFIKPSQSNSLRITIRTSFKWDWYYNGLPNMKYQNTIIENEFAEAFDMWACRLIVTAINEHWARVAATEATGYGASIIGCDAEVGVEQWLTGDQTPDGRPGVAILFFAFNANALAKAVQNRTEQSLLTCPTTAIYDGMPRATETDQSTRFPLGQNIRYFGDGFQKSKHLGGKRFWRIPVMDGECLIEETVGSQKAIAGGNLLICGKDQLTTLHAATAAVEAIAPLPNVITPFPGGIARSGSKVGSRYKNQIASTHDQYCPTLKNRTHSKVQPDITAIYEIIINGLTEKSITTAMQVGIETACQWNIAAITAGNYQGKLGKYQFHLHDVMGETP